MNKSVLCNQFKKGRISLFDEHMQWRKTACDAKNECYVIQLLVTVHRIITKATVYTLHLRKLLFILYFSWWSSLMIHITPTAVKITKWYMSSNKLTKHDEWEFPWKNCCVHKKSWTSSTVMSMRTKQVPTIAYK